MTVTYEQSLEDVFDWVEHQQGKRKRELPLRAIIPLVIIAYGFLQRGQHVIAWVLFGLALSLAAGPCLAPWQQSGWRQRIVQSEKAAKSAPEWTRLTKTVTLEERGLRVVEPNAKREVLHYWESVGEPIELERLVVVKLGQEPLLLPRRAFETPEACASFVAELRGKIPVSEAKETPSREP